MILTFLGSLDLAFFENLDVDCSEKLGLILP